MKFLEWNNKYVGDFDIFAIMNEKEKNIIMEHYHTTKAEGIGLSGEDRYFYFINSINKTLTPMPMLSLAFGGQYNDYIPYGNEIANFNFNINDYKLVLYER